MSASSPLHVDLMNNVCVQDGMTALMLASTENYADVAKTLLTYGASVHTTNQVCYSL